MPDIKMEVNALKTWLVAVAAHFVFLALILYVNLNRSLETSQTVEVGFIPETVKNEAAKEVFTQNPPKEKPRESLSKSKKTTAKTDAKPAADKNAKPGAKGGSTYGFDKGDGDASIKTGGSGEGYGIGGGGQGGQVEDMVYHVGVDQMPEPFGGITAIQSKVKIPEGRNSVRGNTYVLCFIDENGTVRRAQVTKGLAPDIDAAAVTAIKRTRFKPGKDKGKIVKVQMVINIPIGN